MNIPVYRNAFFPTCVSASWRPMECLLRIKFASRSFPPKWWRRFEWTRLRAIGCRDLPATRTDTLRRSDRFLTTEVEAARPRKATWRTQCYPEGTEEPQCHPKNKNGKLLGWGQKIFAVELLDVDCRGESTR